MTTIETTRGQKTLLHFFHLTYDDLNLLMVRLIFYKLMKSENKMN